MQEDVWVSVLIKNIAKLQVKLYEINIEAYYKKNLQPFSSDINLDGLIAQFEEERDYRELPSSRRHYEHFFFP
jgi:hypothetical protein